MLGKFILELRNKKQWSRNNLAEKLNISYSKLQNIEKESSLYHLSHDEMEKLKIVLGLNKIETLIIDRLYLYSQKNRSKEAEEFNTEILDILLIKEEKIISKNQNINEALKIYLLHSYLMNRTFTLNDYNAIMWSIKLEMDDLLEELLYLCNDKLYLKNTNFRGESPLDLLENSPPDILKKMKAKLLLYLDKIVDISREDINKLQSELRDKNLKIPVYKVRSIEQNKLNKLIIDLVNFPDYLQYSKNILALKNDYNLYYFKNEIESKKFTPRLRHNSLLFINTNYISKRGIYFLVLIYENRLLPTIVNDKADSFEVISQIESLPNLVLNKSEKNFTLLGELILI